LNIDETVTEHFYHIRILSQQINLRLSGETTDERRLSNELAGMFAVTVVATYESIVKDTLISYAGTFHSKYKDHVINDYDRLNARISIDDLRTYSRRFGLSEWSGSGVKKNSTTFHKVLFEKRAVVERRFRKDLVISYNNLFTWRNAYAHERATPATFKDVYESHRVAQYVIRSFVKAFKIG
jgi:hypothetical protein